MDRFSQEINNHYGMDVIQHGNLIGAWYRGKPGATPDKLQDTVYLFDANGYTGSGSMWGFYNALGGRNYPPSGVSAAWR